MAVPFSSLLKKQKIGKKKIKSALTALTSEREELGQMEEDKETALGVFDTKKEAALGQIETGRTEALGDLPNQLQALKEGKDPALAAVKSDAAKELSPLMKKIGTWDEETGTGTGLTSDYMEAQGSYNTALSAYKVKETAFSESDLGQKMSGFKDKYKTYDPSAAQDYSKQLTGEMKADKNWGAYQKSTEWRNRLDAQLKKHGWNPEDFYISQNEKGEITRHGVGVKNPQGWLISKDDKVGGRNVWDVMYEHSQYKDYFSEVEGKISEADTEYESQQELAYGKIFPGRSAVRRIAKPTDYEVFVEDSEKDLKTLKKSDTALTEAETALGSWDPETKTGSGALGELGTKTGTWDTKYKETEDKYDTTDLDEKISGINTTWDTKKTTTGAKWDTDKLTAEGEWDTKIGTQKTDISQIYEPAHTGATTALTALTARIKKYRLLGLADEGPKKSSTYKKPQMGYGAGYLRRSA